MLPFALIGVVLSIRTSRRRRASNEGAAAILCQCSHCVVKYAAIQSSPAALLIPIAGVTVVYSLLAHKEFRYLELLLYLM